MTYKRDLQLLGSVSKPLASHGVIKRGLRSAGSWGPVDSLTALLMSSYCLHQRTGSNNEVGGADEGRPAMLLHGKGTPLRLAPERSAPVRFAYFGGTVSDILSGDCLVLREGGATNLLTAADHQEWPQVGSSTGSFKFSTVHGGRVQNASLPSLLQPPSPLMAGHQVSPVTSDCTGFQKRDACKGRAPSSPGPRTLIWGLEC
ncbi:hypothetical protein NDU88_005593 [Pleurodeles waltl]|uniref:Uncharacterized protein n=1 Tax=Pleurodeles waltl TaxID=8319 RepID=A0AAV7TAX7_PLEWA|nr:hypothetical protein NDU88_005593 [Pleurodeles waltl]